MRLYEQLPPLTGSLIRLLELRLVSGGDRVDSLVRIEGRISTNDLRDEPDYDALSYAWGPKDLSAHLTLNGETFPVSQNLFTALQQLCHNQRKTGQSRKLWVDAVCINQSNNVERSHQVVLMKDIYSQAKVVFAWIGAVFISSILAFDTFEKFASDDGTYDGSATYRQLEDSTGKSGRRKRATRLLLSLEYFKRMWIVQEVVVAKKVFILCGAHSIDFDHMRVAFQRMTGSGFLQFSRNISNPTYLGRWRDSFLETRASDRGEFLDLRLFIDSRDRIATDPRDKIYSLRGIANKALGTRINVNYDDPVEAVYTDFAKTVLSSRPDLQILSAVIGSVFNMNLPSYVPDWSTPTFGGGILQRYYRFRPTSLFHAAGNSTARVTISENSNTIEIEGSRLDTIVRVIPINTLLEKNSGGSFSIHEISLRNLAKRTFPSDTYSFSGEPSWVAFFRTLTADRTALSPRIDESYRSQYFRHFSGWGLRHSSGDIEVLAPYVWQLVSKDIGTIIEDKHMFLTTKGYLGLGHGSISVGDIVCILSGGEVPFILRETDTQEDGPVFKFLCESYVHGVMDGEAVSDPNRSSLENFRIE